MPRPKALLNPLSYPITKARPGINPLLPERPFELTAIVALRRAEIKLALAGERNEALSFQPSAVG
jgi:hypothetical protein